MTLNQDGACQPACAETQLTNTPGHNLIASWGKPRVTSPNSDAACAAPQQRRRSQSDEGASDDADGDSYRHADAVRDERVAGITDEARYIVVRGLGGFPRGGLIPAVISVPVALES